MKHVLWVEDNEQYIKAFVDMLRRDARVNVIHDASTTLLRLAEIKRADVVILDLW